MPAHHRERQVRLDTHGPAHHRESQRKCLVAARSVCATGFAQRLLGRMNEASRSCANYISSIMVHCSWLNIDDNDDDDNDDDHDDDEL